MYDELVDRLRNLSHFEIMNAESVIRVSAEAVTELRELAQEAADAIDELDTLLDSVSADNDALCETIERLKKPRWIPVTERLPEEDVAVLTWGKQAVVLIDWHRNGKWFVADGITHWMPLPQPPTERRQTVTDSNKVQEGEE